MTTRAALALTLALPSLGCDAPGSGVLCRGNGDCTADPTTPICHRITGTCVPRNAQYRGSQDNYLAGSFRCPRLTGSETPEGLTARLRASQSFLSGRMGTIDTQGTALARLAAAHALPSVLTDDRGRVDLNFQAQCYATPDGLYFTQFLPGGAELWLVVFGRFEVGPRKFDFGRTDGVFGLAFPNALEYGAGALANARPVVIGVGSLASGFLAVSQVDEKDVRGKVSAHLLPYSGAGGLGDACAVDNDCGQPNYNFCVAGGCVAYCEHTSECGSTRGLALCVGAEGDRKMCLEACDADTDCPAGEQCDVTSAEAAAEEAGLSVGVCSSPARRRYAAEYNDYTGDPYDPADEDAPDFFEGQVDDDTPEDLAPDSEGGEGGGSGEGGEGGGSGEGGEGGDGGAAGGTGGGGGGGGGSGEGGGSGSGGSGSGGSGGGGTGGSTGTGGGGFEGSGGGFGGDGGEGFGGADGAGGA